MRVRLGSRWIAALGAGVLISAGATTLRSPRRLLWNRWSAARSTHGSTRRNAGGSLYNYGALGFTQGIMDAFGGGTVNKRTGPGTGYALAGSVADGTTVNVSCMWTGVNGPVNGTCP